MNHGPMNGMEATAVAGSMDVCAATSVASAELVLGKHVDVPEKAGA